MMLLNLNQNGMFECHSMLLSNECIYVRLRDACICRMNDRSTRFHSLLYMTACTGEIHMHWEDS